LNWNTADADFTYWATVGMWSLDESVALLLGKSPGELHWKSVQPFIGSSDFAKEYDRVRALALKSEAMNRGQRPVPPSVVLEWAAEAKIDIPAELTASMEARQAKKLAIAAMRRNQTGGLAASTAPTVADSRTQENLPSGRQISKSPNSTGSAPVLTKVVTETPQQRRMRLSKRREQLKQQGVRELGKQLASEEGVSPKRVRAILKKPKTVPPR
jgi:hypothetical protein